MKVKVDSHENHPSVLHPRTLFWGVNISMLVPMPVSALCVYSLCTVSGMRVSLGLAGAPAKTCLGHVGAPTHAGLGAHTTMFRCLSPFAFETQISLETSG